MFVFDETDPNQSHYLGVANIPLITLSHDKEISGSFELVKVKQFSFCHVGCSRIFNIMG